MARYRILKPISFLKDGKIVQIRKPAKDGYELPDDAVAALGDAVELIAEAPEETVATSESVETTTTSTPTPETTTAESTPETTEKAADTASTTPTDAAPGGRVRNGKRDSG